MLKINDVVRVTRLVQSDTLDTNLKIGDIGVITHTCPDDYDEEDGGFVHVDFNRGFMCVPDSVNLNRDMTYTMYYNQVELLDEKKDKITGMIDEIMDKLKELKLELASEEE